MFGRLVPPVLSLSLVLGFLIQGVGCASAPPHEHLIESMNPMSLRLRRPTGPAADPHAGPGGVDYRSQTAPTLNLDCEKPESLFKDVDLKLLRQCLASLSETSRAVYRLQRDSSPFLYLEEDEQAPACLRQALEKIPVPREILFLSKRLGGAECFSSRLNIEADRVMGVRLPKAAVGLRIDFPLDSRVFEKDENLLRLLSTWAITPIWDADAKGFRSKLVPESICQQCIGKEDLERAKRESREEDHFHWPPES